MRRDIQRGLISLGLPNARNDAGQATICDAMQEGHIIGRNGEGVQHQPTTNTPVGGERGSARDIRKGIEWGSGFAMRNRIILNRPFLIDDSIFSASQHGVVDDQRGLFAPAAVSEKRLLGAPLRHGRVWNGFAFR